jgi:hypothetical protein
MGAINAASFVVCWRPNVTHFPHRRKQRKSCADTPRRTQLKKIIKSIKITFFKTRVPNLIAGMITQWGGGDGRILLGDGIGSRAVMLRPIRLRCAGVWVSTGLPRAYIYSRPYVY